MVSYDLLYFFIACCKFSFFIFNFIDLSLLLISLNESGYWFINFVYCLKNQLLFLLIFDIVHFFFIHFFFDPCDFFPSADCGFFGSLFLVAFGVMLSHLFNVFVVSCGRFVLLQTSLSTAFTASHMFWVVMFSLSFTSSFLISSVICWLFRRGYLASMSLCFL